MTLHLLLQFLRFELKILFEINVLINSEGIMTAN
jgi:hypothetical protein